MEKLREIKVNLSRKLINVTKSSNPINRGNLENTTKTPHLPKDFFETVIECEVKLKEKFNIKIFQKLAYYYSAAVSYYESINDPRYILYNQSLNLLFSLDKAKKYLAGGTMKEKLKKEKIKEKMKDCDKAITTEKVQNFIKRKGTIDSKERVNNLISKEMSIQQNEFKRRLEEKKKKYKLSISDNVLNNDIDRAFLNVGIKSIEINDNNESMEFISEKDLKFSEKELSNINSFTSNTFTEKNSDNSGSCGNNLKIIIDNNILDDLKNEDLKNNEEKKIGENSLYNSNSNESFENKLDYKSELSSIKSGNSNKNNIRFTKKTQFLEKMNFNFDMYSNDYYDYFIKKIADKVIKDYSTNYQLLTQNLIDITVNSINQEKEMEYLLTSDSDETYKNEITNIIQQLKDEEILSKEKLISENNEKIEKLNNKYIGPTNQIQCEHEIKISKERLKLDTTKSLVNLFFK